MIIMKRPTRSGFNDQPLSVFREICDSCQDGRVNMPVNFDRPWIHLFANFPFASQIVEMQRTTSDPKQLALSIPKPHQQFALIEACTTQWQRCGVPSSSSCRDLVLKSYYFHGSESCFQVLPSTRFVYQFVGGISTLKSPQDLRSRHLASLPDKILTSLATADPACWHRHGRE